MSQINLRETLYPNAPTVRQYLEKHYPDDVEGMARGLQPATLDEYILVDSPIKAMDQYARRMNNGQTFSFMFWVNHLDKVVYFYAPPAWNREWLDANGLRDNPDNPPHTGS